MPTLAAAAINNGTSDALDEGNGKRGSLCQRKRRSKKKGKKEKKEKKEKKKKKKEKKSPKARRKRHLIQPLTQIENVQR